MPGPRSLHRMLPALLLVFAASPASAQSAADILEEARATYERQMAGIENYTVVQNVMGQEATTYFVRTEVDGNVAFQPQFEANASGPGPAADPAFFYRPDVAERMTYEGTDDVDGESCHVVRLENFEGLDLEGAFGDGEARFEPESMEFCVDTDEHMVRRMAFAGTASTPAGSNDMEMVGILRDYREVEGMLHPFRVEMTMTGMGMGQNPEMAEAMAQMQKQLEQLPEAQREQMEEMMKGRMEAMQQSMGATAGEPIVVETVEVRVNAGPPAGG